jgi:preprotein translocase subunit SecA
MFSIQKLLTKLFGSRNERLLKRYHKTVEQVNALEDEVRAMPDEAMRERAIEMRKGIAQGRIKAADILPEAFALMRESMDRHIGIRAIFNPDENFNPDALSRQQFSDDVYELYDSVQKRMIGTGEAWTKVPIPHKLYDALRQLYPESRPPFRARCFDVQLIGGLVLYEGKIAEMATGEGKTFVAPLACFMRALEGMRCHVVTVNDYLVRRDASWVRPAFENLGMTVGFIQSDMEPGGETRKKMYQCDITYGTNAEFGFDYLRDNMKERADLQVQGPLDFAIVDEVDSILIDEARTPLIISGAAHDDAPKYRQADQVARRIMEMNKAWSDLEKKIDAAKRAIKAAEGDLDKYKGDDAQIQAAEQRRDAAQRDMEELEGRKKGLTQYYEVEYDRKSVHLTHEGIAAAQDAAGVGSFYVGANMEWPHLMEQAMRAHVVYERDKDYVVERGQSNMMEVVIVDEYTGRKMIGRQWSDGLHQAIEAKERVPIKQETQTLATITLQNFFKLYKALAGMTGTAQTEAEEFMKIYKLEVVTIPTNRPCIRNDFEDRVYRTEREKWEAIMEEIKAYSDAGRPVLVGTTSVEKSEMLSQLLKRKYGVEHEVLNAKHHEREAMIVLKAGQVHVNSYGEKVGNVTIATNMAGRGTDIKLAAETLFDVTSDPADSTGAKLVAVQRGTDKRVPFDNTTDSVYYAPTGIKTTGGLHVIGTERHTARRIDNQLRGRSARQGDPGSSRFYVSLQDDLMKMFAGEWTIRVLGWLGMGEGMAIEDRRITKGILRAQKKVEERNFLARKNLLEYDEVMDYQRTIFYRLRQRVLLGRDVDQVIWKMIDQSIDDAVTKYIDEDFVAACIAEWAKTNFEVQIEASDLKGMRHLEDLESYIKRQARADAETTIPQTLDEFMGEDRDNPAEWNTRDISSWAMSRFHVALSQAQIKKMDAHELEETLITAAVQQVDSRSCAGLMRFLEPLYAERALAAWAKDKFNVDIAPEQMIADMRPGRVTRKPSDEIVALIGGQARAAYTRREIEYPIDHMLAYVFGTDQGQVENPYAADMIRAWALNKWGVELSLEHISGSSIRRLRDELIGYQEQWLGDGKLSAEVDALIEAHPDVSDLAQAVNRRFDAHFAPADLQATPQAAAPPKARAKPGEEEEERPLSPRERVLRAARQFLRSELTMLEQFVLIQIFDQSWKDHLYAMDILKSGIGLHAFAERDPRVLYKKEGYRYFEEMMENIRDKVTDLIFRARIAGRLESRSAYRETAAKHDQIEGYGVGETLRTTAGAEKGEMAQAAAQAQGEGAKVKQIVREGPKVGRNDPCPCGSGKKYKKCCGAKG